MIRSLSDPHFDEYVEAKKQGYKFIKVYLNHKRVETSGKTVTICGAVMLKGTKGGLNSVGQRAYEFREIRGGASMIFRLDESEREFICYMYDDPGRGYFSPVGFNRDFLASHMDRDDFIIRDPEVHADIKLRYEYMKANPGKKYKGEAPKTSANATRVDIENEINHLQERLGMMKVIEDKEDIEKAQKEKAFLVARDKVKLEEAEKKKALMEEGAALAAEAEMNKNQILGNVEENKSVQTVN